MDLIREVEAQYGKKRIPVVHVGDTVQVDYLIREGEKERIQVFNGTVIAIKGRGINRSISVRRIVQGEGVERVFPLHGPRVQAVRVSRRGDVRRAKLYYLRDRKGKRTRVKELLGEKVRREAAAIREAEAAAVAAEAAEAAARAATAKADSTDQTEEAVEV